MILLALVTFGVYPTQGQTTQSNIEYCECSTWNSWSNMDDIQCGYVVVPEDHDTPSGKKIKVAFAIFESQSEDGEGHPTLILTGGPGGRALNGPGRGINHHSRKVGDVIIVEQRGIGLSNALPNIAPEIGEILAMDIDSEKEIELSKQAMTKKVAEIKALGIDPSKYNSTQNAKDFGVLMDGLGYKKYNLYGTSYGTKLGMMIMKYFSPKINAAILDGPATLKNTALESRFPDLRSSLNLLFERCDDTPECKATYPNLKDELITAVNSLKEEPITVQLLRKDFTINSQDLLFFIRYLLYRPTAFDYVPQFVRAVNDRDLETITQLGQFPATMLQRGVNISTFYSFNLYEEYSDETPANVERIMKNDDVLQGGLAWFQGFIPVLDVWHGARVTAEENRLENITIPTLIITNDFDPVTPPHNTKLFEKALTNEQVVRLNRFGHGAGGDCMNEIRNSFLLNPDKKVDLSCLQ